MTLPAEREIFGATRGVGKKEANEWVLTTRPVGGDEAPLRNNYLQIIRLEINLHQMRNVLSLSLLKYEYVDPHVAHFAEKLVWSECQPVSPLGL